MMAFLKIRRQFEGRSSPSRRKRFKYLHGLRVKEGKKISQKARKKKTPQTSVFLEKQESPGTGSLDFTTGRELAHGVLKGRRECEKKDY